MLINAYHEEPFAASLRSTATDTPPVEAQHMHVMANAARFSLSAFESQPPELLLKILRTLDLTCFHHLCQTSKYIRAFIKLHAIELCNNIVRVKLKDADMGRFFDMQERRENGWLLPTPQILSFTKLKQATFPFHYISAYDSYLTTTRARTSIAKPGPLFAYFLESKSHIIKLHASRMSDNMSLLPDILGGLVFEDFEDAQMFWQSLSLFDRFVMLNAVQRAKNFRRSLLLPLYEKLRVHPRGQTIPRVKELIWFYGDDFAV